MSAIIDYYFSFRSPYSYLSVPGMMAVRDNFKVDLRFRPVLPQAIRNPEFFKGSSNKQKVMYILLDWQRRAEMLGLPHQWPNPDPVVQDRETFAIAEEQPYIYKVIYVALECERRGKGLDFAKAMTDKIWGGTENWHCDDHYRDAVTTAGLDADTVLSALVDNQWHQDQLKQNSKDHDQCGHTGVPTMVYNGEPFFGQDRIDSLCFQLTKDGLAK